MRLIYLLLFLIVSVLDANIDSKLSNIKKKLSTNNSKNIKITQTLEEITRKIRKEKRSIKNIEQQIKKLRIEINQKRNKSADSQKLLNQKKSKYTKLLKTRDDFKKKLTQIILQMVQLDMMKNKLFNKDESTKNYIDGYIYKSYLKRLKYNFREMEEKFFAIKIQIVKLEKDIKTLNNQQKEIQKKITELNNYKKLKAKKNKNLIAQKKMYQKKLSQVLKENAILHRELQKTYRLKEKQTRLTYKEKNPSIKVKFQDKSSANFFRKIPITHYHGKKTIAPFKKYVISRKFGKYVNPEYKTNFSTYNPNVILKPIGSKNVRSIFDGKVLTILNNSIVGKVVVIGHDNGMHILYAHFSSISPLVKKGKRIKKGYILGKVNDGLLLEITKNNANINPMEVIK